MKVHGNSKHKSSLGAEVYDRKRMQKGSLESDHNRQNTKMKFLKNKIGHLQKSLSGKLQG